MLDVHVHVHAVEAGDECGDHQHDAEAGHALHDGVDVVRDDGGEGIHRARQDVAVDVDGVDRLLQLDEHVVQQSHVQIVRVLEDVFQATNHHFVATDTGVEVDQRFLQLHQSQQVLVADALLQLFLCLGHDIVDLFQVFQEPHGRRIDDAQDEVQLVVDGDTLALGVRHEVRHHLCAVVADGDDDFVIGDDADGHGDEGDVRLVVLHGYAEDGQQPVALGVGAWAFVHVGNVRQESFGHVQLLRQEVEVVVVRALHVHPAVGCPFGLLGEAVFAEEVSSHRAKCAKKGFLCKGSHLPVILYKKGGLLGAVVVS